MFHFCCLYNQLFSVPIFHGRNNPVFMLCWRSSGICRTIHPVSPQYLKWICAEWCQTGAGPGARSGAGTWKISRSLPSPQSSKDTSSVLCNSQMFCPGAMAQPGEVLAVLPSHKAEEYLGPARAGSEEDFPCPLGRGFLTIGILSLGEPSIHPSPSPDSNPAKERRSSLWHPFCWEGLGVAFGFNYPVHFSACLNFDCTGWAGCIFPWNKVLHPSWESAGRPQEQSLGWARGSVPEQGCPGEDWEVLVLQEMMQIVLLLLLTSCFRAWCGGFCFEQLRLWSLPPWNHSSLGVKTHC